MVCFAHKLSMYLEKTVCPYSVVRVLCRVHHHCVQLKPILVCTVLWIALPSAYLLAGGGTDWQARCNRVCVDSENA